MTTIIIPKPILTVTLFVCAFIKSQICEPGKDFLKFLTLLEFIRATIPLPIFKSITIIQ